MSAARPLFSEFNGFLSKNGMRSINFQEVEEGGESRSTKSGKKEEEKNEVWNLRTHTMLGGKQLKGKWLLDANHLGNRRLKFDDSRKQKNGC